MAGCLRHRENPTTYVVTDSSSTTAALREAETSSSSSSRQGKPQKRTLAGDQLLENKRPFVVPVGKQWEIYPYVKSRKVSTVQGALLKLFYPDMIGLANQRKVAKSWKDYKWSASAETPSAAANIKREFWLRYRCASDVNLEEADRILDINLKNLVRHMICALKKEAFNKVYMKESVEEEYDDEGNAWPKVEELMNAKPDDFATTEACNALCQYWSTPSFRKKSLQGKENRLAGGGTVYHCSGSRGLVATQQYIKNRDGVDPGKIGAWHHQHRMQQGTNRVLCSKKAATIWVCRMGLLPWVMV